ncbi:MAG: hypothetical protein VB954_12930 [Thalassolituus sp.]|uniref:hypothetical protein n=1 Tax=Thalassolituus sp. TaxID=2030822 RepID=UPI003982CD26
MINSQVIDIFRKYGFDYKKSSSNNSYMTFTYKSGFFHNAEVVQIGESTTDEEDINIKIKELERLGISIKRNKYETIEEVELGLFRGFFDVDNWKKRIKLEYNNYVSGIVKSFSEDCDVANYSYIDAPYSIDGIMVDSGEDIIASLSSDVGSEGAKLILVEAPAGFGKTSTSYELINSLVSDEGLSIPFFTEFSRDRQARIFNHVFIREVDRAFSQVKSPVVIQEVQNGRVTMVLDGFDELLSDESYENRDEDYENAEPMLQTVGELLEKNAKVVITSRRAAIFDGSTFNEWIQSQEHKFSFRRYRIHSPKIENWLDSERRTLLFDNGVDLTKVSNPVLLSYLKTLSKSKFEEQCKSPNEIVSRYFTTMLEREMERQNLRMNPDVQSTILASVAGDMCDKNYTSERKDRLIDFMKSQCGNILEESRKLYTPKDRPTLDSLAITLSSHAFFDRSSQGEGNIEFVNEFIFGNYIAEHILSCDDEWMASDERFIEPAVNSYEVRTDYEKGRLWESLSSMSEFLTHSDRFKFELKMLNGRIKSNFSFSSINSVNVVGAILFDEVTISDICFNNCVFYNSNFFSDRILNPTFINCTFYDCNMVGSDFSDFEFLNCSSNNNFLEFPDISEELYDKDEPSELTKNILRKFVQVGSGRVERLHIPLASIYKLSLQGVSKRELTREIKRLKRKGLLHDAIDNSYIAIDNSRMREIRLILGVSQ